MSEVTRAGARLHYTRSGQGPAIVFSHGWACSARMWEGQVAGLQDRFTVVTWDALGHDRSDAPDSDARYATAESIADLRAVLDAADVSRAVLVGHSMGGLGSVRFALTHPDRVAALVLVGAGAGSAARTEQSRAHWNAMVRGVADDLERYGLQPPPDTLAGSILGSPEPSLAQHQGADGLARAARGTLTYTDSAVLDALPSLQPPLLLLVGENDADWIRTSVEEAAAAVPGALKVVVADAGHAVNLEHPDIFNDAIAQFADKVTGGAHIE